MAPSEADLDATSREKPMIVVMRAGATSEERGDLERQIRSLGLEAQVSKGEARDVLLVVGETRGRDLEALLAGHPATERLVPVLPQRRYEHLFSRRSFLDSFVAAVVVIFSALAAGAGTIFFLRSGRRQGQRDLIQAGAEADYDRRPFRLVEWEEEPILVVRSARRDFHALSATCTHSEICQVEWDTRREQLVCPCHRAAYDAFGNVLHGPPPRPLRTFPVAVIRGQVYVKTRA